MRTGRTLTVFRWRPRPKNLENPPEKLETPQKFGDPPGTRPDPPHPENLEEPPLPKNWRPPWKFGDPPGPDPPRKFGGTPPGTRPPPVDRMTHACENITLAKTSFRPGTTQSFK